MVLAARVGLCVCVFLCMRACVSGTTLINENCACVCVCVRERERERVFVCVCLGVSECAYGEADCVCVCVFHVQEREREWQYVLICAQCLHRYSLICALSLSALQHTATHCNTLQHTATHCNTLQHIAMRSYVRCHCLHCVVIVCIATQAVISLWVI